MAIISVALARQYASQAGFVSSGIDTIVAIAQAESSLNTSAQHTNNDGSLDRGILQINNRYHSEVSDSCAYDAACSFQQGYRISNKGTSFNAWSTYTSGAYLRYMPTGSSTLANGSSGVGGKPWYKFPLTHGFITQFEGNGTDTPHYAVDLGAPMDTPFFFLESGTIDKESYQPWGGEVFEKPDAGGPEEYVFHLDQINVTPGQHVQAGEVVGLSGGQTSGGSHPTSPQYSTGPHIHFGRFTNYVSTPDPNNPTIPFGPDPSPLLAQAEQSGLVAIGSGGDSGSTSAGGTEPQDVPLAEKVNAILSEFPGFSGICLAVDKAEQFPGIIQYQPGGTAASPPPAWTYFIPGAPGIYQGVEAVFQPQDYVGPAIRSVLDTIISNTIPLFLRSMIAGIGFLLVAGLVWKAADSSGLVEAAGQIGAVAA